MDSRPTVAITMGDPAGVGPEICASSLAEASVRQAARCVLYGDERVFMNAAYLVGAADALAEARGSGDLRIVDLANADPKSYRPGEVSALCGRAAWEYVEAATRATLAGEARAIVTAPINKESVRAAGVTHIGHTEMLGALSGVADPLTMFETLGLRVFFLTRHVSLKAACGLVTKERLLDYIERCSIALAGARREG